MIRFRLARARALSNPARGETIRAMSQDQPKKPLAPAPLSGRIARVPDWLVRDFFVRGSTYILGGRGKVLKSSLLLALAAVVTRGDPWPWLPEERAERGSVIWLGGEDAADITHLRMLANHVDEAKFHLFDTSDFDRRIARTCRSSTISAIASVMCG
jgi:hypothetical protein